MTTASAKPASGGFLSKLIVAALLALTVALYLRIVMVDGGQQGGMQSAAAPQASIPVVEGNEPAPAARPLEDLPAAQMALIMQVFAPELQAQ